MLRIQSLCNGYLITNSTILPYGLLVAPVNSLVTVDSGWLKNEFGSACVAPTRPVQSLYTLTAYNNGNRHFG